MATLGRALRLLGGALKNFWADEGFDRAASVAYYSLLSLAPSLYLLGLVLRWLLPGDGRTSAMLSGATAFVPPEIAPLVERFDRSLQLGGGFVLLALPGLVWVASSAFISLEYSFNIAFRTLPLRRIWMAHLKAFAGAALAALLLAASLATTHVAAWLDEQRRALGLPPFLGPEYRWASSVLLVAVTFLAFTLLYKMLPRGRVGWRPAAAAAGLSVVLWEIARQVFGGILRRSPAYGLLTGTLSGVVALLLWIYTVVVVLLLGAEVAALLNGNRGGEAPREPPSA